MEQRIVCKGIKCDNSACGWTQDMDKQYTFEELGQWRNKPCPKCGSNLLTDADWQNIVMINQIMNHPIMRFAEKIGKVFNLKKNTYSVSMNGTGNMNIKEVK